MQRTLSCLKFITFLILTSCGYQFGQSQILNDYETISVPFAVGDRKGYFTSSLVREIVSRTPLRYTACDGDLELLITFKNEEDENIGYRLAPKKSNNGTNIIVAEEARVALSACVTLIDRRSGTVLFGPEEVAEALTFDFEPDFTNINFHAFSLGQLEMYPLAREAAYTRLNRLLAEKIVDTLIFCW